MSSLLMPGCGQSRDPNDIPQMFRSRVCFIPPDCSKHCTPRSPSYPPHPSTDPRHHLRPTVRERGDLPLGTQQKREKKVCVPIWNGFRNGMRVDGLLWFPFSPSRIRGPVVLSVLPLTFNMSSLFSLLCDRSFIGENDL